MAYRTITFAPAGLASTFDIKQVTPPAIDSTLAAERLGQAIRIQTISHQEPTENKLEEWARLQSWLQSSYPSSHAAMNRTLVAERTLIFHWPGSDYAAKPIILMAHQDVVPVTAGTEKDWKHPPFEGAIAEGAIWGRGAIDDKGSLVALFEAAEILAKSGFKPKRSIYIVSGHDEEVGGSGAKAAAQWLKERRVKALFTIDEGSAIIEDAPVIGSPAILIGVAEKGYGTMTVTAKAKGGHSSMPPAEIGTINLAQAITKLHQAQYPLELRQPVSGMFEVLAERKGGMTKVAAANQWLFGGMIRKQFAESDAARAMLHTTIAPTMLRGSPKENVLPQLASAEVNFRFAPWDSAASVMERSKKAVEGLPVELSWNAPPREPSPISSTHSQGWKLIRAAAEPEAPGAAVAPYLVVGGTDSRNFTDISDDVYRFMPLRVKTTETAMFHGTNEHISIENFARIIRFYTRLIATAAS